MDLTNPHDWDDAAEEAILDAEDALRAVEDSSEPLRTVEDVLREAEPGAIREALAVWVDGLTREHLDEMLDTATVDDLIVLARIQQARHADLVLEAAGDRLALDAALDELDKARRERDAALAGEQCTAADRDAVRTQGPRRHHRPDHQEPRK